MMIFALVFALLLGGFIFVVLPRGWFWQRTISAALFIVLIALVYGGSADLLGRPKPMRLEWRELGQAQVIGASMREGEAIHLWLQVDGEAEPRSYSLPWSMTQAQELQTAMQEGQAAGTEVRMVMPGDSGTDEREPKFYAKPQPPLPDKAYGQVGPLTSNPLDNSN
jgi:hypothetical protein